MNQSAHLSVLYQESLDALAIREDGIYIDATFGRGGHSRGILERLSLPGQLIGFDRDPSAIEHAKAHFTQPNFSIVHSAFAAMTAVPEVQQYTGKVNGILMDLGVSSPQLDEPLRGFSFMRDGPLDMRMDTSQGLTAAQWLATAEEQDISQVIKEFGEEKFGKRIAHAIVQTRQHTAITSTLQLAQIVTDAMPVKDKFKHPATRTFQAIRMYINSELEQVRAGLKAAVDMLEPGGRLAVISFHSLEDRLVKRFMKEQSRGKQVPANLPITQAEIDADKVLRLVGRAIKAGPDELANNPRSRSAVLRIAEKL
jgi:16S rRNA (cytosine1402-N4)-methyltransferase